MKRSGAVFGNNVAVLMLLAALISPRPAAAREGPPYTTYRSFADLMAGTNGQYPKLVRVSEPGTRENLDYTGFFFYQCLQFDPTDRYVLGMRVHCQNRDVRPTDRAEVGFIDLQDGYRWTQIGETTAWNWQQGARLQWRPGSNEILWNDRSDDGRQYVCRLYDFKTGARRTLPRPVYTPSPDGAVALTHDFERMKHGGTPYVGIPDRYEGRYAPSETGIWKMDLDTGATTLIMSLERMAQIAYPAGAPSSGCLYFFREGWNPSGSRFIAFVKDPQNGLDKAFSMTAEGTDVRYLHDRPSHHEWRDEGHVLDGRGYYLYPDDGTAKAESRLFESSYNGHVSYIPGAGGDWIVSDTYAIDGCQYLFLYHIPTRQFVPLAKLRATAPDNIYRVDLHPRLSRNGRIVCIDATHENLGRQMYVLDIGPILDHPPGATSGVRQTAEQPPTVAVPAPGYHFKQLLVDGTVAWEQDVAGGPAGWHTITVDVTAQVRGKANVTIAFRLLDKQGVSNFGVRWRLSELRAENLRLAAGLGEPGQWQVDRQGAFETGFGIAPRSGQRRFHIPFISMTAGDEQEFRQRHGDPATPERIAEWLQMSLRAWRDGKCDGVVLYCLDKRPESRTFPLAQELLQKLRR